MIIIEENHSRSEAMAQMPHLAAWASQYGQATNYTAVTHPSLPNYLAIGGGDTFGVSDDNPPSSHPISSATVFGQTIAAGRTAKTYAETMPSNCDLTNSGNYAVKHNEWAYFNSAAERSACNADDVPMGTTSSGNLVNDINGGRLPVTGQMTPNLCNDAHDCALSTADNWLNGWVPKLMAGPDYTAGNLTIVITFDEDDRSAANNIPFVVIDPRLKGKTVTLAANHYSLTRWLDDNAGTAPLNKAATAADLKGAFGL
jgi:acid phosphatase